MEGITITACTSIHSIRIDSLDTLKTAYMPFLKNGGLFLPVMAIASSNKQSTIHYKLQDKLCLLLQILNDSRQYLCITRIVWITPAKISGDRKEGIGLHFDKSDLCLKTLIEAKLSACKTQIKQAQTL